MSPRPQLESAPLELERALSAQKVAIFGASRHPEKFGHAVAADLLRRGFGGEVVLVNPRGGMVDGHPITTDPSDALGADLAVLLTPPAAAENLLAVCGQQRIPVAVVCAAGFREVGNLELENRVLRSAADHGVRLLGPNTMGPDVPRRGLFLSLAADAPVGQVSLVSQSGGLPQLVGGCLARMGCGFDAVVPLGNKADIGFTEVLKVFGRRSDTRAVMLYMEDCNEGDGFFSELSVLAAAMPVAVLIGGRTGAGSQAARSHTGSMLNRTDRLVGMVDDSGAYVARSIREACAALSASLSQRPKREADPGRVLVLSDGGAAAVLAADALAEAGFLLPAPSQPLASEVAAIVPEVIKNPFDLAGSVHGNLDAIVSVLAAALSSREYDAVVIAAEMGYYGHFGPSWAESEASAINGIARLTRDDGTAIVVWTTQARGPAPGAVAQLRAAGIPCVESPHEASTAVAALLGRGACRPPLKIGAPARPDDAWDPRVAEGTERALIALRKHDVPDSIGSVVTRADIHNVGEGTWVLRLDGFVHKHQLGAVKVAVPGTLLAAAYDELAGVARRYAAPEAIRLAPFFEHEHELLVTFWRDRGEGRGWAVGAGGVLAEQRNDLAVGRRPSDVEDVLRVLAKSAAGQAVLASGAAVETTQVILRIADAFYDTLSANELECNPVAVGAGGVSVLDVLLSD